MNDGIHATRHERKQWSPRDESVHPKRIANAETVSGGLRGALGIVGRPQSRIAADTEIVVYRTKGRAATGRCGRSEDIYVCGEIGGHPPDDASHLCKATGMRMIRANLNLFVLAAPRIGIHSLGS